MNFQWNLQKSQDNCSIRDSASYIACLVFAQKCPSSLPIIGSTKKLSPASLQNTGGWCSTHGWCNFPFSHQTMIYLKSCFFAFTAYWVWTALPLLYLLFKVQLRYFLLCETFPNSSICHQSLLSVSAAHCLKLQYQNLSHCDFITVV